MRPSLPASELEEIFASEGAGILPVQYAETGRTDHGILFYRWPSPCDAVECLSLYIRDGEIVLSTKVLHTHIDEQSFEVRSQAASEKELSRLVVKAAINEAAAIMNGERIFTVEYGPSGRPRSYGMSPRHVWNTAGHKNDDALVVRSWDWRGEVS